MTCECNNKSAKVVDNIIASDKLIQQSITEWAEHAGETPSTLGQAGKAQNIGSAVYVPDGGASVGFVGGVVRVDSATGKPFFIIDSSHNVIGLTGVEQGSTSNDLRVRHEHMFSKVGTFVAAPDESFAPYMLSIGGSVAQGVTDLKTVAPLYFCAKGDGTISAITPLWKNLVTYDAANSNPALGYLIFNTPTKPLSANQPIVNAKTDQSWTSRNKNYSAYSATTAIKIGAFSEVAASVRVNYASGWSITGYNNTGYSASAASGLITITHPAVKNGTGARFIQALKNNYDYVVDSYGKTTTVIKVFNAAGTQITAFDSTIDFIFSFDADSTKRALEPISASDEFTVFAGYYYVPVSALGQVPSGNIWMMGAMNK